MDDEEEKQLQAVALQNANSIFLARQRAEQELIRTREALEIAQRAAVAASEAKGRFVSMISHELRTPLGAIAGYAALLEEGIAGPLSPDQRDYVARIRHNQAYLLRLVNELLDLAKIESGQFPLSLADVPVQGVLDSVRAMIEPQIRVGKLHLEVLPCDPALHLHADGERVEQIVLNLLSNAVKFTPPGGVVRVITRSSADRVRLEIQDTGIGIPAGQLEAIFEPFFQVESSPFAHGGGGTGLGLAISRELARSMSGDLTVESASGKGSTFTLIMPRGGG